MSAICKEEDILIKDFAMRDGWNENKTHLRHQSGLESFNQG